MRVVTGEFAEQAVQMRRWANLESLPHHLFGLLRLLHDLYAQFKKREREQLSFTEDERPYLITANDVVP